MEKTIYILGAGAIGKTLAVVLKLAGKDVVLLRGSVDDGSRSVETMEILLDGKAPLVADISVDTLSHYDILDGIIVLTNKSYGNEQLARTLRSKTGSSPLVILQNGLGVEQVFTDNGYPEVYRCVLFTTSQTISASQVRYKPVSVSPIGVVKGHDATLRMLVDTLNTDTVPFRADDAIQQTIWRKAILNSAFNSICPLLEADNGIFHRNETALGMARQVIAEGVAVAKAKGVILEEASLEETLLQLSRYSDGQLISTFQDILHKRPTEIETLNIEIVRVAETLSMGGQVTVMRLLGELTRLKSALVLKA